MNRKSAIGLKRGTVQLSAYNKEWPKLFESEKKRLAKILGDRVVAIEHEGSTSVPGLPAKPLIDVLVGLRTLKNGKEIVKIMEKAGYHYRPNWGRLDQHILFAKGNEKSRTHYIHVIKYDGVIWKRDILFRDYLRTHPKRAKQYADLKKKLAKEYSDDRGTYTKRKSNFILETIKLAAN